MTLSLPDPITVYFEISNGSGSARLAQCFTEDAVVTDENCTHRGLDAIQAWKHEARSKFDYSVEPVSVARDSDRITVTANLVGNFPGSPVLLDHKFELAGDKIKSLQIG